MLPERVIYIEFSANHPCGFGEEKLLPFEIVTNDATYNVEATFNNSRIAFHDVGSGWNDLHPNPVKLLSSLQYNDKKELEVSEVIYWLADKTIPVEFGAGGIFRALPNDTIPTEWRTIEAIKQNFEECSAGFVFCAACGNTFPNDSEDREVCEHLEWCDGCADWHGSVSMADQTCDLEEEEENNG
jgi:hypothetical protein